MNISVHSGMLNALIRYCMGKYSMQTHLAVLVGCHSNEHCLWKAERVCHISIDTSKLQIRLVLLHRIQDDLQRI